MTREEQIEQEALTYAFDIEEGDMDANRDSFIAGAAWADAHPMDRWISVEDALPEEEEDGFIPYWSDDVLVVDIDGIIHIDKYDHNKGNWTFYMSPLYKITHWMPLPSTETIIKNKV